MLIDIKIPWHGGYWRSFWKSARKWQHRIQQPGEGGGQETWNLYDRLWRPSFLWLICTGAGGAWPPRHPPWIRYWMDMAKVPFSHCLLSVIELLENSMFAIYTKHPIGSIPTVCNWRQKCIPVGCVPPACCQYLPACTAPGEGGCTCRGGCTCPGSVPARRVYLPGVPAQVLSPCEQNDWQTVVKT